jgi:hypothetical protein
MNLSRIVILSAASMMLLDASSSLAGEAPVPAGAPTAAAAPATPVWTPAGWGPHGKKLYYFMVFADAIPGKEQELDRWYERIHAPVVIEDGDFVSAQRFTYSPVQLGGAELPKRQHLVIFTIETNDIAKVAAETNARLRLPRNVRGDALDYKSLLTYTFEAIGPQMSKKQAQKVLAEETAAGHLPPAAASTQKP